MHSTVYELNHAQHIIMEYNILLTNKAATINNQKIRKITRKETQPASQSFT